MNHPTKPTQKQILRFVTTSELQFNEGSILLEKNGYSPELEADLGRSDPSRAEALSW
jgi:hypothetical protein